MAARNSKPDSGSGIGDSNEPNGNASTTETVESETFDPAAISAEFFGAAAGEGDNYARDESGAIKYNKDGTPRKKRGRKSGGKNASASAQGNTPLVNGIETLANSLMVVHIGIASLTKFDEFALSDTEANTLSKSIVNVMQEFDIAPDPRLVAVTGLITTAGMIYGPRMYNYSEFRAAKKRRKQEE